MQIQVNTDNNVEGRDELAQQVEAPIEAVLRQLNGQLTRVELHLSDENAGNSGRADKLCIMEARPAGRQPVTVAHQAATLEEAYGGAARKLQRLLESTLDRQQRGSAFRPKQTNLPAPQQGKKQRMHTDGHLMEPLTVTLKRASTRVGAGGINDLLFLEVWETGLVSCPSAFLRVRQIRRANPGLAAEIRAELARGSFPIRDGAAVRVNATPRLPPDVRGPIGDVLPPGHSITEAGRLVGARLPLCHWCPLFHGGKAGSSPHEAEAELRRLNQRLEMRVREEVAARLALQAELERVQGLQALGRLAGGIVHDFNNVLQNVRSGLTLIARHSGDAEVVRSTAHMAAKAVDRGVAVTKRLLAFARRTDPVVGPVDVSTLLEELHDLLSHTLTSGIEVHVIVEDELPPLLADREELATVLVNLALNARDAMPSGGRITFGSTINQGLTERARPGGLAPGAYLELWVRDTGTGMDAATLARAREPFFTTKPSGEGTGLGLALARDFAERSRGALSIESEQGRGTTVILCLPQAPGFAC